MGRKGIFIGLGGAGVKATAVLKEKLLFGLYKGNAKELGEDCQFVFIDTDHDTVSDINKNSKNLFMEPGDKLIDQVETVQLGDVVPYSVYRKRKDRDPALLTTPERHLLSWVDELGANSFTRQQLEKGASANRQQARVAFWDRFGRVRSAIQRSLGIIKGIKDRQDYERAYPVFHILTGTCGGTGSAIFLDVAFMLNMEFKRLTGGEFPEDPTVRAVFFMPQWYLNNYIQGEANATTTQNYYCNAYSFFDEVDAILKNAYAPTTIKEKKTFQSLAAYPDENYRSFLDASRDWGIFNFALCVDTTTETGFLLDQDEMYQNTAEFLYHWHVGSAQGTMISQIDNGQFQVYHSTRPGDPVPAFFTMGYRALEFPQNYLIEYLKARFLYELFKYGLIGKGERELPDDDVRRKELNSVFNDCIGQYLFSSTIKNDGTPNLEDAQRAIIDNNLSTFSLASFLKKDKDEVDPDKIGDAYILGQLITEKESLAAIMNRNLERAFLDQESPVSADHILGYIEKGHSGAGCLEQQVENNVLLYGLEYTIWFLERLDNICEERIDSADDNISDLYGEREKRLREKEVIRKQVEEARQICLTGKKKQKIEAIGKLYGLLQQDIRFSGEVTVINQQTDILKRMSIEGSGVLEVYLKRLRELKDNVNKRLHGDERSNISGFSKKYQTELPRRFMQTRQNVTTTYVPDIASFFAEGEKKDHLFARLYEKIVPQSPLPGGDMEPLRYGQNFGKHAEKKGLHGILWDMLARADYDPHGSCYLENGSVSFFRLFFGPSDTLDVNAEGALDLNAVLDILEKRALVYMEKEMERSPYISGEVNKPLSKRIDSTNIESLSEKFDDLGTQTFCRMQKSGGAGNAERIVYAGNDQELAKKLKFDEKTQQFVPENTPNRIIKLKLYELFTIDSYPHYSTYREQYKAIKAERHALHTVFAPHIHTIFNNFGTEEGLRRLEDLTGETRTEKQRARFVSLLLYRELCDTAKNINPGLLDEMFFSDPRLFGSESTLQSPLIIVKDTAGTGLTARVCGSVEEQEGKILLREGNNITIISGGAHHYKNIFDTLTLMRDYLTIAVAADSFDREFKKRLTAEWLPVFEKAFDSLLNKITKAREQYKANNTLVGFYGDLGNDLIRIAPDLKQLIETSRAGSFTATPDPVPSTPDKGSLLQEYV